jgi:magnesium chelatase subunit D
MNKNIFPFTALVGQGRMKSALVLNVIHPGIGGLLIWGEKGTAKSTAVRALANLLPEIPVVAECPFSCDPEEREEFCERCRERVVKGESLPLRKRAVRIVELPLGATEERVLGSFDLEEAIKKGERHFEPGLLAAAHRGILYIDEVNLLSDHLMDILLDAAAMGVNYVEREGISFMHAAGFILIGTMNPEEGELRPQLLDRFGLCVEVGGIDEPSMRAEVVRRRIAFETAPVAFHEQWKESEEKERERILAAKRLLPRVGLSDEMLQLIARTAIEARVDGLRPDIVMHKTACALAAYAGRTEVREEDVLEAAELALHHRRKGAPEKPPPSPQRPPQRSEPPPPPAKGEGLHMEKKTGGLEKEQRFEAGESFSVRQLFFRAVRSAAWMEKGRRTLGPSQGKEGRYVRSSLPQGKIHSLALDATLRAAAPYQSRRRTEGATAFQLRSWDLREKIREKRIGNLILFLVDASGSMGAWHRMVTVKGAILSLLKDAYQKRDRVGLLSFRGAGAELLLPPTGNFRKAETRLKELPTGGRTPLAHGLRLALQMFQRPGYQERPPFLVLVSDGRANVSLAHGDPMAEARSVACEIGKRGIPSLVLDAEAGFFRLGLAKELARAMSGVYLMLEQLEGNQVAKIVRRVIGTARKKRL